MSKYERELVMMVESQKSFKLNSQRALFELYTKSHESEIGANMEIPSASLNPTLSIPFRWEIPGILFRFLIFLLLITAEARSCSVRSKQNKIKFLKRGKLQIHFGFGIEKPCANFMLNIPGFIYLKHVTVVHNGPCKKWEPNHGLGDSRAEGLAWRVNYKEKKSHKSTFFDNWAIVGFHMDECSWDTWHELSAGTVQNLIYTKSKHLLFLTNFWD